MVNAIGNSNINPVQIFSALNAFKPIQNPIENIIPETSDGININDDNLLQSQNLEEIMQVAKTSGEENLSSEDIKYGLTYGRSVIADYVI